MKKNYIQQDLSKYFVNHYHQFLVGIFVVIIFGFWLVGRLNIFKNSLKTDSPQLSQVLFVSTLKNDRPVKLISFGLARISEKEQLTVDQMQQRFTHYVFPAPLIKENSTVKLLANVTDKSSMLVEADILSLSELEVNQTIAEDGFLHRKNPDNTVGPRLKYVNEQGEKRYVINPGNFQMRQFIVQKLVAETENSVSATSSSVIGIYIPAIDASLGRIRQLTQLNENSDIAEFSDYPPENSDTLYAEHVIYLLNDIRNTFKSTTQPLQIWIRPDNSFNSLNDQYMNLVDGIYLANFGQIQSNQSVSVNMQNELNYVQKWLANNKKIIVSFPPPDTLNQNPRFNLAAYLLVAQEDNLLIHSDKNSFFVEYPEYYYALGQPISAYNYIEKSPNSVMYARQFTCGQVEINMDQTNLAAPLITASIQLKTDCNIASVLQASPSADIKPTNGINP